MSTYVVGDIQGCYKGLRKLLKQVEFKAGIDRLWCVGDLVNRGPRSLDTLRFLRDLGTDCCIVLGNHDLHFIAKQEGCAPRRGKHTLQKLLKSSDAQMLADWLRKQPLVHFDCVETQSGLQNFLMLHAGVAPQWSLQQTLILGAEVELALQGNDYRAYLKHMYGDTPRRWHDGLEGLDRLRVITNYLTRVRYCDAIGNMQLSAKEGLAMAPRGYKPWFKYEKISAKAQILFGHWAALQGHTGKPRVHALDTGFVWGQQLTALRLEDGKRFAYSKK